MGSLLLLVVLAYSIAVDRVHSIMVHDISSVASALEKTLHYISSKEPQAYKDELLKKDLHTLKVGKSGYVYLIASDGTLLIHPTKEGGNLKNTDYGAYITSHKEAGTFEYHSSMTGEDKIAAFTYIPLWDAWIVPGTNKIEQIQYMSALSFENGGFINEVDAIASQIKDTDSEIDSYLSFFKLSRLPREKVYVKKTGTCRRT